MCGIIGIFGSEPVNQAIYDGLTVLQHRGQDAAGMMTSDGSRVFLRKDNGLVRDVFHTRHMLQLEGFMGIGHVRYPTAGSDSRAEAQPFYVNAPFGMALCHNGNLTNARQLRQELFETDLRHINTTSDSEILLNVFAYELQKVLDGRRLKPVAVDLYTAVRALHRRCQGAYALVLMIVGVGIIAIRDPHGIRPLVYGKRAGKNGVSYMFASESVALNVQEYELIRDVAPGEAILVDMNGKVSASVCADSKLHAPCIFEYVYLARPDSVVEGIAVHRTRLRMGEMLAQRLLKVWPDHDVDVIIPVPDTSRTAALQMAYALGLTYREGFIKNRYIGRTFIMPGQAARRKSVRQKLNAISQEFYGKNVLLVDDSIVRGTTSTQIIQLAREAGARKVYLASAAPAVRFPNVYGIDMPSTRELVAHNRTIDEIAAVIGADWLLYQKLEDLERAVSCESAVINQFDSSCFNGHYVTGNISSDYLQQVDLERSDEAMLQRRSNNLDLAEVTGYQ
ncbi:MAG TPA: amidophosphoribosyltransferase [Gammaproteobacteria bacterium]|nr:amidophosphoribosyltransferase [Gammaproteobacteria bacterium]